MIRNRIGRLGQANFILGGRGRGGKVVGRFSGIAFEEDDVPVGEHVLLAFEAKLAGITRFLHGAGCDQVFVRDHFGFDESLLEVGVNDSRALGAVIPLRKVQARASFSPAVRKLAKPSSS